MIDILLATYNAENFFFEQMDSIIEQDCNNWELLIRDGGSSDKTLDIVNGFSTFYPDKIKLIPSHDKSTALENFSVLLEASTALYIMFADHDDIWRKDKVRKSLAKIKDSEELFGSDTPLLIFTDKYVEDENLGQHSYFKYQKLNPSRTALNYLLTQNIPSGCTMLINRPLVDLAGQIPPTAVMHDHWLSLVAAAFGKIVYLDEPTLYYRQHKENVFGASLYGWGYFYKKYRSGLDKVKERFYLNVEQAHTFLNRYKHMLSSEQVKMLEEFSKLREKSWFEKRKILMKHKIYKSGWRRNIGTMLII